MHSARACSARWGLPGTLFKWSTPMKALVQAALGATALTALVATIAVAQERMVDINKTLGSRCR